MGLKNETVEYFCVNLSYSNTEKLEDLFRPSTSSNPPWKSIEQ